MHLETANATPPAAAVLYGLSRSVYTRIARLALEEKAVDYTLEEVEIFGPRAVPEEHLARHPFGRIPAFAHGAMTLYETGAITRYVDESFAGPALQPRTALARARMNQVIGIMDAYAYRPMIWGVFVQRVIVPATGQPPDEALVAESLATCRTCLHALASILGAQRYYAGDAITLADLHAVPMLLYFALTSEGEALLAQYPGLVRWLAEMQRRDSVQRTKSRLESA